MRLIDADALMNQWCDEMCKPKPNCEEDCAVYDYVRLAPTIEPKRGEWIEFDTKWGRSLYYCTNCMETSEVPTVFGNPLYDFCPNCGADMRGEE